MVFKNQLRLMGIGFALAVLVLIAVEVAAQSEGKGKAFPVVKNLSQRIRSDEPLKHVTCFHAVAWASEHPGAIDFSVACAPRGNQDRVVFSIVTYSVEKEKGSPRIIHFRRRPLLLRNSARVQFGSCQLHPGVLDCEAATHDPVRVRGRLWLKPRERCSAGLSIFVVRPANCEMEGCHPVLVVKRLYRGIARGC